MSVLSNYSPSSGSESLSQNCLLVSRIHPVILQLHVTIAPQAASTEAFSNPEDILPLQIAVLKPTPFVVVHVVNWILGFHLYKVCWRQAASAVRRI